MRNVLRLSLATALAAVIGVGAAVAAPARNVSPGRHPNLAAAQQACHNAWERIVAAQKANEWDMGGHAQKAKDLLDQASTELKMAAEAANTNGH